MARKKKETLPLTPETEAELSEETTRHTEALAKVSAFVIADQGSMTAAENIVRHCKDRIGELEDQRKAITGPLLESKRRVDALFAPVRDTLEAIQKVLREKISARLTAQRAEQSAALALVADGARTGDVLAVAHGATNVAPTNMTAKQAWAFEIVDPDAVPREACEPSEARIRAFVAAGGRSLAGVRIYETTTLVVR